MQIQQLAKNNLSIVVITPSCVFSKYKTSDDKPKDIPKMSGLKVNHCTGTRYGNVTATLNLKSTMFSSCVCL